MFVNGSCTEGLTGLPTGEEEEEVKPSVNRRYVIDESVGSVSVLSNFGSLGGRLDVHEFRVFGGRLRSVHQISTAEVEEGTTG